MENKSVFLAFISATVRCRYSVRLQYNITSKIRYLNGCFLPQNKKNPERFITMRSVLGFYLKTEVICETRPANQFCFTATFAVLLAFILFVVFMSSPLKNKKFFNEATLQKIVIALKPRAQPKTELQAAESQARLALRPG